MQLMHERIVVSVGGSLIVPDRIDTDFLARLKSLILEHIGRSFSFVMIAGGGKTARRYQAAAQAVTDLSANDLDWIGIHSTRLNGHLLRTIFRNVAHPVMITNPDEVLDVPPDIPRIVAAGYRPGASTDLRAVQIAARCGATKVVNLSNIDYVYDRDPRENADANKIERISWTEFRALIPVDWDPGLSSPFDPVAAKEAERLSLEVAIINGAKLDEFSNYLAGKSFMGTIISR
jgi:uridylate kinase